MNLFPTFQAWCKYNGIQSSLCICESDSGFRFTILRNDAVKPLLPGTEIAMNLLRVPVSACIIAKDSESLVDRLKFERSQGAASNFAPYIDVLPSLDSFEMPRFWSADRLESVTDGGQLARELETNRLRYCQDPWALACVDSRSHFLPSGEHSLTPVLDMINHSPEVRTRLDIDWVDGSGIIGLDVSGQSFGSNEQTTYPSVSSSRMSNQFREEASTFDSIRMNEVKISYGNFSNLHTLVNYGFIYPGSPCNSESISIRLIHRQSPIRLTVEADGIVEENGLSVLRRALANREEREIFDNLPVSQRNNLLFVSKRNEEEVLSLVAAELEVAVEQSMEGSLISQEDALVASYLFERALLLRKAQNRIELILQDA